jgi:N-acetylglucosamine kinase-like BadF-type ATPase
MFFLGIAVNGEQIEFQLVDSQGRIQGIQYERHVDVLYDGRFSFRGVLESGIARVCLKADIRFDDIVFSYFAVPGFGEHEDYDSMIEEVIKGIFVDDNYIIENEVEAALVAALANEAGIAILVGAGSVAMGKNERGDIAKSGGWGIEAGDEAGEYWFAKKILEIFTKEADGRYDSDILYGCFKQEIDVESDYEIINFSLEQVEQYGVSFRSFVGILFDSFYKGDPYAEEVFREAVQEYILLIHSLMKQIQLTKPIRLSLIGHVFEHSELLTNMLVDALDESFEVIQPRLSIVSGAALKALMFRRKVTFNEIRQMVRDEVHLY